jgi:hypothetical protein
MTLVQRNHEVQIFSSQGANDAFTDRIDHGRPYRRLDHAQSQIPDPLVNFFGENSIPVMNQEAIRVIGWNRFAELPHGPLRRGMRRDLVAETAELDQYHASGVVGASGFDLPLLIVGQRFAQQEISCCHSRRWSQTQNEKASGIEQEAQQRTHHLTKVVDEEWSLVFSLCLKGRGQLSVSS